MSKRFILAVAAGSVTNLLAGFLLYGLAFGWLFREGAVTHPGVMRETPGIPWILAGQLGFGILVALMIEWRGATSFSGGMRTGALFGFLMAVGYDFAQYGTSHLWTLQATLFDPLITALMVGASGGVTGFVLGRGPASSERGRGIER